MTDARHIPEPQPLPEEASHAHVPEYVLVFRDDITPPKEHAFAAISDDAAAEWMRKQYPRFAWALYHVNEGGGRGTCFYLYPGQQEPVMNQGRKRRQEASHAVENHRGDVRPKGPLDASR